MSKWNSRLVVMMTMISLLLGSCEPWKVVATENNVMGLGEDVTSEITQMETGSNTEEIAEETETEIEVSTEAEIEEITEAETEPRISEISESQREQEVNLMEELENKEWVLSVKDEETDDTGGVYANPLINEVITEILNNYDVYEDGYYTMIYDKGHGYKYEIGVHENLEILLFSFVKGKTSSYLKYNYKDDSLVLEPGWRCLGEYYSVLVAIDMVTEIDMHTYRYGDILTFIVNPLTAETEENQNSHEFPSNIQESANEDFKNAMYNWNFMLEERSGYSLKDLGFESFEKQSTDDWDEYFSNYFFVRGVTLNRTSLHLPIGSKVDLKATVQPTYAMNQNVTWSSKDENIVTVSDAGVIRAVGDGTTKVIVKTEETGFVAQCKVTVTGYYTGSEHYTCVRSGKQTAGTSNWLNPQTIWMHTKATFAVDKNDNPIDYDITLEEMYCGTEAEKIIKEESSENVTPGPYQQWVLFKFSLANRGKETIKAGDVISTNSHNSGFYDREEKKRLNPYTAIFSGFKNGNAVYNVSVKPGQTDYFWIGVLLSKNKGFPYLKLSNGYGKYAWFDTDPGYGVCRVYFEGNGGKNTQEYKEVFYGETYGKLPTPINPIGYEFVGWSKNAIDTCIVTESSKVYEREDHQLYAVWLPKNYTVSFNGNGGESTLANLTVTYDENYGELPTAFRKGYSFAGWYDAPEGGNKIEPDAVVDFVENKTLYAQWIANEYRVIFDSCGGREIESKTVTYDNNYGTLPIAEGKRGCHFAGWYTQAVGGEPISAESLVKNAKDHTIYAQWNGNEYKVSFDANGGNVTSEGKKVVFGEPYGSLPEAESDVGFFAGWYTEASGGSLVTESSFVDIDRNHILYAKYGNTVTKGIEIEQDLILMLEGEEKQINVNILPDNASDQRVRWTVLDNEVVTVANGLLKGVNAGRTVVTATSVNGEYKASCSVEVLKIHTLTFMNGDNEYKRLQVIDGETIPLIELSEEYRTFIGWWVNGKPWDVSSPVTHDMVLTAQFIEDITEESREGTSALDTQPRDAKEQECVELVVGQKFVLPGSGWMLYDRWYQDKNIISVTKNGSVIAKKSTNREIKINRVEKNEGKGQVVESRIFRIVKPAIDKKISLTVGQSTVICLQDSENLNVHWVSAAPDIAAVESDGTVRGISSGSTVITAYINGVALNCKVKITDAKSSKRDFVSNVKLVPLQSINFNIPGFNVKKAVWYSDLQAKPAHALAKGIAYENAVVRIAKTGKITAIGSGKTTITAVSNGKTKIFTVEVSAPKMRIVHLNINESKNLKISGTKGVLSWKPSDHSILQIKKNKIEGIKAGITTLTAKYENMEYKVIVYVEDPTLINEQITGMFPNYKLTIREGEKILLEEKQVYQSVLYLSNKNNIAFVDENGILIARNKGVANVTANVNGKKIKIKVTVI